MCIKPPSFYTNVIPLLPYYCVITPSRALLGADAITSTMDGFFDPKAFKTLPQRPNPFRGAGLILHLVSYKEGIINRVRHLEEIEGLASVLQVGVRIT
jgi:hypothetical protein